MNVRIGINPLTWTNDDLPALGDDIPLETCLEQAAAAGYAGVELGRKFPREAAVLGPLLKARELDLVSGWYSLKLAERDVEDEYAAMRSHFKLLSALGCTVMVCAEVTGCIHGDRGTRLSRRPQFTDSDFSRFATRIEQLASRMRDDGMRLAYHHHMGTLIQSETDIDRLMEATDDSVCLLLDTGHLLFAGGDPLAVARRHAHRIAHVHCKDIRQSVLERVLNADTSFLEAVLQGVFTVPGDGCIDYRPILAELKRSAYEGWLVVEAEQDPAIADPQTFATLAYGNLSNLVASC